MKKSLLSLVVISVIAASGAAFAASTAKDIGTNSDLFVKSLGQKPSVKDFKKVVALKNADQKDHAAAQQGQVDIDKAITSAGYKAQASKQLAAHADKPTANKGQVIAKKGQVPGLQLAKKQDLARGERAS